MYTYIFSPTKYKFESTWLNWKYKEIFPIFHVQIAHTSLSGRTWGLH
jgi:hypothetical protein